MAIFYYNDATADGLLSTVGNWWSDSGHTTPAGSLPTGSDTAVLSAGAYGGTCAAPATTTYEINGATFSSTLTINGANIEGGTFNGIVTLTNYASINGGTFNARVLVRNFSAIYAGIFNDSVQFETQAGNDTLGTALVIPDYPAVDDVRDGVVYAETTLTGTLTLPGESVVLSGTEYGGDGDEFTGSYVATNFFSDPGVANVEAGVNYKFNSPEDNRTGTFVVPGESVVLNGTDYGAAEEFTGTYDPTNFFTDPGVANVEAAVEYKYNSAELNRTGTFAVPAEADVKLAVNYGAASEFTGELGGGVITILVE